MIPESYRPLITSLAEKTSAGQVNWKPTAAEDTLVIYFKDFSLGITSGWEGGGYSGEPPTDVIAVNIYNSDGTVIDTFRVAEGDRDYDRMTQLHAEARRKALRIDDAISSLMEQLESEEVVGDDPPEPDEDDDLPF